MRKITYFLAVLLFASQAWASYIVVLKNGTRYRAKERFTVSKGKAIIKLENGTTLQLDPALIDIPRSEEATRLGYGDAKVIATPEQPQATTTRSQPSLGEITRLRRQQQEQQQVTPVPTTTTPAPSVRTQPPGQGYNGPGALGSDVTSKFVSAYENVGLYDAKVSPSAAYTLRVQLTADNEDQVFKAISATAWVMIRVPGLTNQRIDRVELFMATLNGGPAGRFQMSQEDAAALDSKKTTLESYFVRKVLF